MKRFLLRLLLPVSIVGASVGGAAILVGSAESAERAELTRELPLVEVVEVSISTEPFIVQGNGLVEAAREVTISPEVAGKLVRVSDRLVEGGRLRKGDLLVKIDPRPYALAIRERKAQVEQSKLERTVESARGEVAAREWKLLRDDQPDRERSPLALREPHKQAAAVAVESAEAALERARYDHSRTSIRAPFNATVASESVEEGQYVAPGSVLATLVGTDAYWIRVSLPVEALSMLKIPELGAEEGSRARIRQSLGTGGRVEREGRVIRLINRLDPRSRTAQVLVEVDGPLDAPPGQLPLLRDAFVEVELEGKVLADVLAVPVAAVSEGRVAWVVTDDDTLQRRELDVLWKTPELVYVTGGLSQGERVLTTDLPLLTDGMQVRVKSTDDGDASPAEAGQEAEGA